MPPTRRSRRPPPRCAPRSPERRRTRGEQANQAISGRKMALHRVAPRCRAGSGGRSRYRLATSCRRHPGDMTAGRLGPVISNNGTGGVPPTSAAPQSSRGRRIGWARPAQTCRRGPPSPRSTRNRRSDRPACRSRAATCGTPVAAAISRPASSTARPFPVRSARDGRSSSPASSATARP
ncbi:hypothetical protein [Lysobacter gummosus]|uniref:hypothetical protein n=1 Tax=Lysobacter gummosus TaxID=262324 RepID=UPI003626ECE3